MSTEPLTPNRPRSPYDERTRTPRPPRDVTLKSTSTSDVIAAALDHEFPADLEAPKRQPSPAEGPASSTTAGAPCSTDPSRRARGGPAWNPDQHHRQPGRGSWTATITEADRRGRAKPQRKAGVASYEQTSELRATPCRCRRRQPATNSMNARRSRPDGGSAGTGRAASTISKAPLISSSTAPKGSR